MGGPMPRLPSSGTTGRLPSTTTHLPVSKRGAGKIVVMLSSVAKPPPAGTQALSPAAPLSDSSSNLTPADSSQAVSRPPPLPPKQVSPVNSPRSQPRLSTTTHVKLPPKTSVPRWSSLSGTPIAAPRGKESPESTPPPPPVPAKEPEPIRSEPKKSGPHLIPPIKLNELSSQDVGSGKSIFFKADQPIPAPKPEVWKNLEPGEANPPAEGLQSLEVFSRSHLLGNPTPEIPGPEAKDEAAPLVAPPLRPPSRVERPVLPGEAIRTVRPASLPPPPIKVAPPMLEKGAEPSPLEKLPPRLPPPLAKPAESIATPPHPIQVAPPMLEKAAETAPLEKLPPPLPPPLAKSAESIATPPHPIQVAPPMLEKAAEPFPLEKLPPPLPPPLAKSAESIATPPPPIQVAPPMLEKAAEPFPLEKLPPPNLPAEARKGETSLDLSESPVVQKVPAMIQPEAPSAGQPPELPPKPLSPPTPLVAKEAGNWLKKTVSIVLSPSPPKVELPPVVEAKPALKPAVLPKRSLLIPMQAEAAESAEKSDAAVPTAAQTAPAVLSASAAQPPEATPAARPAEMETPSAGEKEKPAAKVLPAQSPSDVPVFPKAKRSMPQTRAARAQKRRVWEVVVFYFLFAVTVLVLFFGSLYFCRDTRVEGQAIPPAGMTLNNEVWIVSDFWELATGVAEDLAAERTPLMQEIHERQDHVQRTQADVASREERIRLVQEEIQASKDEIASLVKQSRDATQQIWDGEGSRIDEEYASRLNQLQKAISDRSKSLNLKYQPDNIYQSPEVWANAYRLALYDVPAGVDSVKEHQWLGAEMKQWRDFLKTLDDRKEQLRDKAAQLKLAPAPRIADLNTKLDELQHRIESTEAQEVPLKAELQQAQADLAAAQAEDAVLDDKYYKQLDSLPAEAITKHIPLTTNGRFTWVDDDVFAEGEKERHYWIFARATRADGRQYWALHHLSIGKNETVELIIEPTGFISTKAILRPNLSPEEQEQ